MRVGGRKGRRGSRKRDSDIVLSYTVESCERKDC